MLKTLGRGLAPKTNSLDLSEKRVALIGDSITAGHSVISATNNTFENVGWFCYTNFHLYQRFEFSHVLNLGVSEEQTGDILLRVSDLAAVSPDIVIVFAGTNDIANQVAPATTISNLDAIYTYITGTLGAKAAALTITPRSEWPGSFDSAEIAQAIADIKTVNAWILSRPGIIAVDTYAALDDGNDEPLAGYTYDGKHPSSLGAAAIGRALADALEPLYGKGSTPDYLAGNLLSNGDMSGTSGTVPAGAQGTLSTSWDVQMIGGTSDNSWRIFSKTADGKLRIEINVPQGNGDVGIALYQAANNPDTLQNYIAEAEIEVVSLSSNITSLMFEIREEDSGSGKIYHTVMDDRSGTTATLSGRGILRTPEIDLAYDAEKARARLIIEGSSDSAPVTATLIVYGIRLVPVS